jgi:hypothetical protein
LSLPKPNGSAAYAFKISILFLLLVFIFVISIRVRVSFNSPADGVIWKDTGFGRAGGDEFPQVRAGREIFRGAIKDRQKESIVVVILRMQKKGHSLADYFRLTSFRLICSFFLSFLYRFSSFHIEIRLPICINNVGWVGAGSVYNSFTPTPTLLSMWDYMTGDFLSH